MTRSWRTSSGAVLACVALAGTFAFGRREAGATPGDATWSQAGGAGLPAGQVNEEQVLRGRQLVVDHGCGGCHSSSEPFESPASKGWLAGMGSPEQEFRIGPCLTNPDAQPCFRTRPRNLTPDNLTGLGRFSERQIFNALRFGLRPGETPDVEITSTTPGQGNFPANPKYLAPPMPWPAWRHMSDQELRDIAAYLKHGVKPVRNKVSDSEGPPDFWASAYTVDVIGTYPAPPFPAAHERTPDARVDEVLRGRKLVMGHACAACHGGVYGPEQEGWLVGMRSPELEFLAGACATKPGAEPCFRIRPRNLTPDDETGLGRITERQIFNALRYGLRPAKSPDAEITSGAPGQSGFPAQPHYLSTVMPWSAWRHMSDAELRAIAAYLKLGLKPVSHRVPDSEEPADHWASQVTVEKLGPHPAPPFPTAGEQRPAATGQPRGGK